MKIENISDCGGIKIESIGIGECIMYKGQLHMKVDMGSLEYGHISKYPNVVVNLETNTLNSLKDFVVVQRVNAKIVVE